MTKVRDVVRRLEADGWYMVRQRGSHRQYRHDVKRRLVTDLPGCVSTGATEEEVLNHLREAIRFHLDGLREEGLPIPAPSSRATYVSL